MMNRNCRSLAGVNGALLAVVFAVNIARGADVLDNGLVRAEFNDRGLVGITEKASDKTVRLMGDGVAVVAGDDALESDFTLPVLEQQTATNRIYRFQSGQWTARVIYELQPGWHFISKQLELASAGKRDVRVHRIELLRGTVATPIAAEQRIRDGILLRFGDQPGEDPTHGLFFALQNPFLQIKSREQQFSMAYAPEMSWNPTNGAFVSDRLLLGPYVLSGVHLPAQLIPEWKFTRQTVPTGAGWIDRSEVNALVGCVRPFLLWHPTHTTRINIGWCENDYQIDVATPEGRAEYKRIMDQAAAIGCRDILFAPNNSEVASLQENRDAWGWENLLWFGMGQKIRKGEWDPAKDKLPASVQELMDYAKSKDVGLVAYVYPSLPFMQNPEWTSWVPNGKPGGYLGADTGQRSFQDWLLDKLVAFHDKTGASGYSFDHWWIAYDDTPSSHYAQWAGCRRILEELRRRIPEGLIDGRQQYHYFGVWTWLAGTYPHPLNSDEQPQSFRAFPDLHWDRVSADRQRRTAYWYRTECFVPIEIMPGYMTHQTPRLTEKGECPRDRFRSADWDLMGWKYSVISSLATAPFNLVVNYIPARDEREDKAFSAADQQWFRDWFDWTDANLDILRHVQPILGPPQLGQVDGTAAFKDGHGFIFLFNPNYRALPAQFRLDQSIGLTNGERFTLRQLYPDAEKGLLLAPPDKAFWNLGDMVTLPLVGTEALVLEVSPAPTKVTQPLLIGAVGQATLNGSTLELGGVRGEAGSESQVRVVLPTAQPAATVMVNGKGVAFSQNESVVSLKLHFTGAPFPARAQIGTYDPTFAGGTYQTEAVIPSRVFAQLEARRHQWPVDYTQEERATAWLNSDRLLLFINVAEPNDETMTNLTLKVDGRELPVKPAYTSIVRSNPLNTFVGWYADLTALKPDVKHTFEVGLPKLAPGQFQGLFLDTVDKDYTNEVTAVP